MKFPNIDKFWETFIFFLQKLNDAKQLNKKLFFYNKIWKTIIYLIKIIIEIGLQIEWQVELYQLTGSINLKLLLDDASLEYKF